MSHFLQRRHILTSVLSLGALALGGGAAMALDLGQDPKLSPTAFRRWRDGFQKRALAAGISPAGFARAFDGIAPDLSIVEKDRKQSEFSKAIWDYLDTAVSESRIQNGRAALKNHASLFAKIERRYGVESHYLAAIWGLESAYGAVRGNTSTVQALATLAFEGRRAAFFETQLIAALRILDSGIITPKQMLGSWAGAMGHMQFMPTSLIERGVDFNGDGRVHVWGDDPSDALASAGAYLAANGWAHGIKWGHEVILPTGFDYALADRRIIRRSSDWGAIGVQPASGGRFTGSIPHSILLPAGARGPALMISATFGVLERYNKADAYVIAVGHLADRLNGGPAFKASWPRHERILDFKQRVALQRALRAAGHDPEALDGIIGPRTINALRAYQIRVGLPADGFATQSLLARLQGR